MGLSADNTWLWQWVRHTSAEERLAAAIAVYSAEDFMLDVWGNWNDELGETESAAFVHRSLEKSEWDVSDPELVFDLDANSRHGGYTVDGVIHLPTESSGRLGRLVVLHELSHHIAPDAGHGPMFCRVFLDLVAENLGAEVATDLLECFEANGVAVAVQSTGEQEDDR
jgi:hypothetical protein